MAIFKGPNITTENLLISIEPINTKYVNGSYVFNGACPYNPTIMNQTNPIGWGSWANILTYDELSPTSAHIVKDATTNSCFIGFRLTSPDNGWEYIVNYRNYDVECDLEVVSGGLYMFVGSSFGGYQEGNTTSYGTGTHHIKKAFHTNKNYYLNHTSNIAEISFKSNVASTEYRVTNLRVTPRSGDAYMYNGGYISDGVMILNGSSYFGAIEGNINYNRTNFSVVEWVNYTANHTSYHTTLGFTKWYTGAGWEKNEWLLGAYGATGPSNLTATVQYDEVVGSTLMVDSGIQYELNRWYHLAFTWSYGTLKIYVNGELKNQDTVSGYTKTITTIQPIYIGAFNDYRYHGNGMFGGGQIYGKTLDDEEVLQNYNASKSKFK